MSPRCLLRVSVLIVFAMIGSWRAEAATAPTRDSKAWGVYTQLVGTTRAGVNGGYKITWNWTVPGVSLV